eukprot:Skav228637  [mRNA]  locus=scaffold204:66052:72705:+ [translate_table: standard]
MDVSLSLQEEWSPELLSELQRVNAPIDERDIELVQQTFARVAMIAPEALKLFPLANCDANMWRPGSALEVHVLKVVETVATAVSLLKDLDTLVPVLQGLGLKHVGYGVQPAHYDVVGQALIATLEVSLGRHFTEPVKNAYLKVWTVIKANMISDNYKK